MTVFQAKKDARKRLESYGLAYQSLKGRTISLQDLVRRDIPLIHVYGIDFRAPETRDKWDNLQGDIRKSEPRDYMLHSKY